MILIELKSTTALAALDRAFAGLDDTTRLMVSIGRLLTESTKQRFAQGVSPEGVKWAPKSQTTLNRYGARKSNRVDIRPLFGPSGALNSTIYPETSRDEALNLLRPDRAPTIERDQRRNDPKGPDASPLPDLAADRPAAPAPGRAGQTGDAALPPAVWPDPRLRR